MARINIEKSLFSDGAFLDLVEKMGRHAALGAAVEAFIIAQEFYLNLETERMIPITEWNRRKAVGFIIDVGLAELRGNNNEYVYVRGSENQFKWLIQRQEAGSKGGRPKSEKPSDQIKEAYAKPDETGTLSEQTGSNPLTPSLSQLEYNKSLLLSPLKITAPVDHSKTYFGEFIKNNFKAGSDTYLERYTRQVYYIWPKEDDFYAFVADVQLAKKWETLTQRGQEKYLTSAIVNETIARNVK